MRRLPLLALLVLGLAACGGSGAPPKDALKMKFGLIGVGFVPYAITISPGGAVTITGHPPATPPSALTGTQDEDLSVSVRDGIGKLKSSLQCPLTSAPGAQPPPTRFITARGKTVSVRGTCEPGFEKLWNALTQALNLNQ